MISKSHLRLKVYKWTAFLALAFLQVLLSSRIHAQTVVYPEQASLSEIQAASEIRRYIFLRTGTAPEIKTADQYAALPEGDVIVLSEDGRDIISELKPEYGNVDAPYKDNRKGYLIKSVNKGDGRDILVITGADTLATLNAAYRFAELLGCHFNLAGDVIPDRKLSFPIPLSGYDEKSQPWFELRGCLPFHDFPTGPDIWNTEDYRSFITQQAKMGFNFFGLHYYNEKGFPGSQEGPEPSIWIGHKEDVMEDGTVKEEAAYKTYWASSYRKGDFYADNPDEGIWGYIPVTTKEFTHGADKLFARDYVASEAIGSKEPETPSEMAANFNNVGWMFRDAFSHARQLGVKTALGTETPMGFEPGNPRHLIENDWIHTCPPYVQARMRDVHGFTLPTERGSVNEAFSKALYEGVFTRIMKTHPLDYFWLWTYETWTYLGHRLSKQQIEAVADDYRYCSEVMNEMNTPFQLATFGWRVGTMGDKQPKGKGALEFHDDLPQDVPFGTLWDRAEGMEELIAAGRKAWSSCWYEEDWGMIQPQFRVTNIWNEVGAGLDAGGVQALIAKHWRMNAVAPASAAHAQLVWENRTEVSQELAESASFQEIDIFQRNTANQDSSYIEWITEFYQNWAKQNFGPERSVEIGNLLASMDRAGEPAGPMEGVANAIPALSTWEPAPSVIRATYPDDGEPLTFTGRFAEAFDIYHQFCSYKDDIVGKGNRDRYMYWYHFFCSQIEMGRFACHRAAAEKDGMTDVEKDSLIACWGRIMKHEIQKVRNISELGVILQLQQATWDRICRDGYGIREISTSYEGEKAVRAMPEISQIYNNERFEQNVIFLGNGTISDPAMYYREIGTTGSFSTSALTSVGGSTHVMKAHLDNPGYDFEYYIQGSVDGETVTYPVTGGTGSDHINKTVITVERASY
jgi:hypothetical protein